MSEPPPKKQRMWKCGHCFRLMGKSSFYNHKQMYFERHGYWVDDDGKKIGDERDACSKKLKEHSVQVDNEISEATHDIPLLLADDPNQSLHHSDQQCQSKCLPTDHEKLNKLDACSSDEDVGDKINSESCRDNNGCDSSGNKPLLNEKHTEEVWVDDADIYEAMQFNEHLPNQPDTTGGTPANHSHLMTAILMFLLSWQKIYVVSDRGIQCLVTFIKHLLLTVAVIFNVNGLTKFIKVLPGTLFTIRKFLGLDRDAFTQYVVCPKCHSIYPFENCFKMKSNGQKVSLKCSHIAFPQHQHQSRQKACGEVLLKKVKGQNGQEYLYPKKVYCYRSLITSLKTFVRRPGFVTACNMWRERQPEENILNDIFDGKVWKDFQNEGFFKSKFNLSLTLNVDWFQPYDHTPYSVGALYMVINNLPREERFKEENVLLIGLLPGPKEPKKEMNSYLDPLANELQQLLIGVKIDDGSSMGNIYKAVLMCISSDIPATRKCGGFVGHGALRGCSKCLKEFPRAAFGEKADYSNFNVETYPERSESEHKCYGLKTLHAKNPTEQSNLEREFGARWTSLNSLHYFKPVRFHVVDPMHNLLLGTAKHVTKVWKEAGIIDAAKMDEIQVRMDKLKVPSNIGRIPNKIASGFSGFTADQWKNWVCVYSLFSLKDVIPKEHYKCWQLFVDACKLLCTRRISMEEIYKGHKLLNDFCKTFARLYGNNKCTMNMHLHMHLKDCILDFGPVYSFWCFSYERFNGILGSYPKNNHSITVQLMQRFLQGQQVFDIQFPVQYSEMQNILTDDRSRGTLHQMKTAEQGHSVYLNCVNPDISLCNFTEDCSIVVLPPERAYSIDEDDVSELSELYAKMYPSKSCTVLQLSEQYKRVKYCDNIYCTRFSRGETSSCIYAKWIGNVSEINASAQPRPGLITNFIRSEVILTDSDGNRKKVSHILAEVSWYKKHPMHSYYGSHVEVWGTDFECVAFVPIQRIMGHCISAEHQIQFPYCRSNGENVTVVVPSTPVFK